MKREDAISLVRELLEDCGGLDGKTLQLVPPVAAGAGYQVMLTGAFMETTVAYVKETAAKHGLICQVGSIWKTTRNSNQPNTLIIYKPKS